ncbi:MAG: acyltransferase [Muribaculaceae bacterium]|nr:acyltransferase [Muribaculaceae bacterium]
MNTPPLQPRHHNNFGIIRYILAYSVLISHFNVLTGNDLYWPISSYYRVCGFFLMSGFFMYGSYMRHRGCRDFLKHRGIRLMPSYLFVVLFFAVALCAVSTMSPGSYFSSLHWWKYVIANVVSLNFVCPDLPGVFENNIDTAVNGSLWTMKIEWLLYFSIAAVMPMILSKYVQVSRLFIAIFIVAVIGRAWCDHQYDVTGRHVYKVFANQYFTQTGFFYLGMLLNRWIDVIRKHLYWLLAAALCVLLIGENILLDNPLYRMLIYPPVFSLFIVSIAFAGRWGRWVEGWENCSYEIYLLHFPLIQLCVNYNVISHIGTVQTLVGVIILSSLAGYVIARYISVPVRRYLSSSGR